MILQSKLNIKIDNHTHAKSNYILTLLAQFQCFKKEMPALGFRTSFHQKKQKNSNLLHVVLARISTPLYTIFIHKNVLKSLILELSLTVHHFDVPSTNYLQRGNVCSRSIFLYALFQTMDNSAMKRSHASHCPRL